MFRYQDEVFGDSDSEPPEGELKPEWLCFKIKLIDFFVSSTFSVSNGFRVGG